MSSNDIVVGVLARDLTYLLKVTKSNQDGRLNVAISQTVTDRTNIAIANAYDID